MANRNQEMNENDLTERIRNVVREEMHTRQRSSGSSASNLFTRTQSVIRSAASDVAARNQLTTTSSNTGKRSSHPWRFPAKKVKGGSVSKSKMVKVLLISNNLDERDSYPLNTAEKIVNGFTEFKPSFMEDDIRGALVEVFQKKYSDIRSNDFEFISVEKGIVSTPEVSVGFEWNFDAIKALMGQGSLCCRLVSKEIDIFRRSESPNVPLTSSTLNEACGSSVCTKEENLIKLQEMFPNKEVRHIKESLELYDGNLDKVVSMLAGIDDDDVDDEILSLVIPEEKDALKKLKGKLSGDVEKLKVDPDDIIGDGMVYYKNKSLDMKKRLRIIYE